jgi:hypothetical protein
MFDAAGRENGLKIDVFKFQKAFYRMKKDPDFKDIMKKIKFRGSPASPYSESLDEALSNLQYINALSRNNPDLILYKPADQFEKTWLKLKEGYDQSQRKLISKIGTRVAAAL